VKEMRRRLNLATNPEGSHHISFLEVTKSLLRNKRNLKKVVLKQRKSKRMLRKNKRRIEKQKKPRELLYLMERILK